MTSLPRPADLVFDPEVFLDVVFFDLVARDFAGFDVAMYVRVLRVCLESKVSPVAARTVERSLRRMS